MLSFTTSGYFISSNSVYINYNVYLIIDFLFIKEGDRMPNGIL
ncbi:hypothetical protein HDF23_000331 [Mucilaginibacter lappiensis]|uniref:Uncharacterized protein n=1 Tax=Mucilaginibacter lappiensis TaxID=354630 RepID=A0ABR6PD09_9SPHI|nr:hypothetical protein [Mucilaginibacter lappiensis]